MQTKKLQLILQAKCRKLKKSKERGQECQVFGLVKQIWPTIFGKRKKEAKKQELNLNVNC